MEAGCDRRTICTVADDSDSVVRGMPPRSGPCHGRSSPALLMHPLFTIGHSTRSVGELIEMLRSVAVTRLFDIRSITRSRTNPQFDQASLRRMSKANSISYDAMRDLGGAARKSRMPTPSAMTDGASTRFTTTLTMPNHRRFRRLSRHSWNAHTPSGARSCAPRRCGGDAIAASWPTTR
jgi:hypothetical protein